MLCPACGFENASGIKFCGECGAALKLKCSSCGFENAPAIKFCGECGKPLAAASKSTTLPPDPRSYTPKHFAEKILQSKSALEGERKQVTVLFADVKGSMDLAERVDPEEWHKIMDRFFAILSEGVHRFAGTVDKFTGDGIITLFGVPIAIMRSGHAGIERPRVRLSRSAVKLDHVSIFDAMLASHVLAIEPRLSPHAGIAQGVHKIFVHQARHVLDGLPLTQRERALAINSMPRRLGVDADDT
jgi:class 3 adenylate cyclase